MNPAFTQEQQQSNPLLRKFAKGARKGGDQPGNKGIPKLADVNPTQTSQVSHPLSNHPCFRAAIDRLCKNNINLIELPGRIDTKPYWKEAFYKKTAFEGI